MTLSLFSDDNECERLKPCSDFCHNSPGSFACSCPFGYTLDIDGRNCLGKLLFSVISVQLLLLNIRLYNF